MTTNASAAGPGDPSRFMESLHYQAPYLIEKLLKERIVDTPDHGEALFTEVKRFLVLNSTFPGAQWTMFSRLVDEVWHQFVLFTGEYSAFCRRYFGKFLHHAPGNAPGLPVKLPGSEAKEIAEFHVQYERLFGTPVPPLWRDTASVTLNRRVLLSDAAGDLRLEHIDGSDMVRVVGVAGPMISVNDMASEALAFILRTKALYVRELPGDLTEDEKIGLAEVLIGQRVLLLAG